MLGALADDRDHLGFVIELDRFARADDRLQMRHHRRQHAEEDRRKFRNIVALRAFLDVVEIIEAEADDLAGLRRPASRISIRRAGGGPTAGAFLARSASGVQIAVARGARLRRDRLGSAASAACRSMTVSPSTTPSRKPLFASKPTIFMSLFQLRDATNAPARCRRAQGLAQASRFGKCARAHRPCSIQCIGAGYARLQARPE